MALPAAVLSVAASLLYIPASASEPLLFLVRFLQGAGAGATFGIGSAWLVETALRHGSTSGGRTHGGDDDRRLRDRTDGRRA